MTASVEIEGLEKAYDGLEVLSGVSLKLEPGRIFALFGKNGSGKSTLIRILSTLVPPDAGTFRIHDIDCRKKPADARRHIGLVTHNSLVAKELSARSSLVALARLHGLRWNAAREKVDDALARFDLANRASDPVRTFSRGMEQRVALARATLHEPSVLLLDEPFTGLDVRAADMLAQELRTWRDEGRTILLVTHSLRNGFDLADDIGFLYRGQIVRPPDDRRHDFEHLEKRYREVILGNG